MTTNQTRGHGQNTRRQPSRGNQETDIAQVVIGSVPAQVAIRGGTQNGHQSSDPENGAAQGTPRVRFNETDPT